MTSIAPSDSESNVSGFVRHSNKNVKYYYISMIEYMEKVNQDILLVEKNMKNLVEQAGPLEGQMSMLLQSFPKPNLDLIMDTN